MGLFSSKTIVTVSTHVSRVLEDKVIPDSMKSGLTRSVLKEGQLVECIIDDSLNGIGQRAERMYQYAGREYMFGRPSWKIHANIPPATTIKNVLDEIEGTSVSIVYSHFGVLNYLHHAWQLLQDNYGYNQNINELTSLAPSKGYPVYLEDIQAALTQNTFDSITSVPLVQWGISAKSGYSPERPTQNGTIARSHTQHVIIPNEEEDHYRVSIIWQNPATRTIYRETLVIPIPEANDSEYFQIKYLKNGNIRYFTYREGAGVYPPLDSLYSNEYLGLGSFFPFGYFRFNKSSAKDSPNSTEYQHSDKLMRYLGLDYKTMADGIAQNPDISDIDSALMMMAVPAISDNEYEVRYLFDFFEALYRDGDYVSSPVSHALAGIDSVVTSTPRQQQSLVIQDSRFKCVFKHSGIYQKYIYGVIGNIGKHTATGDAGVHIYRKQLTETIYIQYSVHGLGMSYFLNGGITSAKILLVPLDRSITRNYSALHREKLYSRSLHYVINTRIETKLKWYQQSWFLNLIKIVAIALAIYSGGTTAPLLQAALLVGTWAVIEYVIIYMIIIPLLVQQALKYLVKELGPEAAMVAAIILMAWGGISAYTSGGIQGSSFAQDLLSLASGLIREAGEYYTEQLKGLSEQATGFSLMADAKVKELEEANKLLEQSHNLSPFVVFGESPDEYYNRTVHHGNIGVAALDSVSRFVELKLTLPQLKDTEEFNINPIWS